MQNKSNPVIIKGNAHKDDRGIVYFVNDFTFEGVKRFYTVQNAKLGQFRGWHGHKKESKYVYVSRGKALIAAVRIDDWKNPSKKAKVYRFELSYPDHSVVFIPPGFVNGFKSLTKDANVTFFSTTPLRGSSKDDIRFPEDYWDI